jgi:hypothetical protein
MEIKIPRGNKMNKINIQSSQVKKFNKENAAPIILKTLFVSMILLFFAVSLEARRIDIAKYRSSAIELAKCVADKTIDADYKAKCMDILRNMAEAAKKNNKDPMSVVGNDAVSAIIEVLKDKGEMGIDDDKIYKQIIDYNAISREAACYALGAIGNSNAIPALATSVKDDYNKRVRVSAAWNLGYFNQLTAVDGLIKGLLNEIEKGKNASEPVVMTIIRSLGEIGNKRAFVPLLKVTQVYLPDYVKEEAQKSIEKIKWDEDKEKTEPKAK